MAIYELDGQAPEFPADGLYWVAETATVVGREIVVIPGSVSSTSVPPRRRLRM